MFKHSSRRCALSSLTWPRYQTRSPGRPLRGLSHRLARSHQVRSCLIGDIGTDIDFGLDGPVADSSNHQEAELTRLDNAFGYSHVPLLLIARAIADHPIQIGHRTARQIPRRGRAPTKPRRLWS